MKKKSVFIYLILLLVVVASSYLYWKYFSSNTAFSENKKYFYVSTGSDYQKLLSGLDSGGYLENRASFERMAQSMGLPSSIHPGKYAIQQGMSNYAIVRMLRSGAQEPVKLVITKLRTNRDILRKLALPLEADTNDFKAVVYNPTWLDSLGIDSNQLQCVVMPNTYEVYWNTPASKVMEKITKYQARFWNETRVQKAKKLGYTKAQIMTIASIVDEETLKKEDKYKIASTYLNRLRIGMPLQADPTLKFGLNNFGLKRILKVHTQIPTAYNTYLNKGLPPGPICTPMEETIDAVLDAPTTTYLYFCAREDFSGYSNFAATLSEHEENARRYQKALNERGIK